MPQVGISARGCGGLAILAAVLSVHAPGQSPTPTPTLPQATITGATVDPDDKDHHFKQCPEHSLTLTVSLDKKFPTGSARAELFYLPAAGASGGSGQSQPATPPAVAMPQSNKLIEAHNNRAHITWKKAVIVFPPDKTRAHYHLGPDCADDGTTLCTAIISLSPKAHGRTAPEPTLAYFYTYQTYPAKPAGPGACAPEPSSHSKSKTAKANSKGNSAKGNTTSSNSKSTVQKNVPISQSD